DLQAFYIANAQRVFDMVAIRSIGGGLYFAVVNETDVFLIEAATGSTSTKLLGGFGPAYGALALAVVDFPSQSGPTFDQELVVSSASGHVTWFKPDEILAPGGSLLQLPALGPGAARTNRTTAASWGLVGKLRSTQDPGQNSLEIATQAGLRWSIDVVTGAATLVKELRQPNESLR